MLIAFVKKLLKELSPSKNSMSLLYGNIPEWGENEDRRDLNYGTQYWNIGLPDIIGGGWGNGTGYYGQTNHNEDGWGFEYAIAKRNDPIFRVSHSWELLNMPEERVDASYDENVGAIYILGINKRYAGLKSFW